MKSIENIERRKPGSLVLSGCTVILFALALTSASFAGVNPLTCEAYANSADHATALMGWDEASTRNARYKTLSDNHGLGVQSDHASHAGWCSGAKIESLADQEVARLQDLNSRKGRAAMCDQYVNDVKIGNGENRGRSDDGNSPPASCGYRGNRWGTDLNGHRDWCMSAKLEDVYSEERGRILDLDRCDACQDYANKARDDRNLATKTRGCRGLSGPRWSSDRNVHVGWCMNARYSSVWDEERARLQEAASCR